MTKKGKPGNRPNEIPFESPPPEIEPSRVPENPVIPPEEPETLPDKEPGIPKEIPPFDPEQQATR